MTQTGHRTNSFGMFGQLISAEAVIALHVPASPRSAPDLVARAVIGSAEVPYPPAAPFHRKLVPSLAARWWAQTESPLWARWAMMNAAAVTSNTGIPVALDGSRRRTPPVMDGFPH